MKYIFAFLIQLSGVYCFAGNDSGGTIFSNVTQMYAQNPYVNLNINGFGVPAYRMIGEGVSDTVFTNPTTPIRELSDTTSLNVFNLKYLGETNNSVVLMLNNNATSVEIMDYDIERSPELVDALRAAIQSQDWANIKR